VIERGLSASQHPELASLNVTGQQQVCKKGPAFAKGCMAGRRIQGHAWLVKLSVVVHAKTTMRMKKILFLLTVCAFAAGLNAMAADGADVYAKNCAKCHGEDGKGKTKMGEKLGCKDYSAEAVKPDEAFKSVKEGLKKDGKTLMKAYSESLSDEEIKASIEHMKTFKK
jgi:cytochrome c553